jgi:hypothetical protein
MQMLETILSVASATTDKVAWLALATILGGLALAILVRALFSLRGTTLISPWCWSVAAIVGVSLLTIGSLLPSATGDDWLTAARFAVAGLTFCPVVSLLGSKRPQDKPWNFVVVSLWGMLALPAAEMLFLQRGEGIEVSAARGWFLWILLALLPINLLPTRFWLAALLATAAQFCLLSEHLPMVRTRIPHSDLAALSLLAAALVGAWLAAARGWHCENELERWWLRFRDQFGLLWGLRVQERVNAAAKQFDWPLELGWSGWRDSSTGESLSSIDPKIEKPLRQSLKGLLRRFVSPEWIAGDTRDELD